MIRKDPYREIGMDQPQYNPKTQKIACVTTTINVPTVLNLYSVYGRDVRFFVAGDLKTPDACWEFLRKLNSPCSVMTPEYQKDLGYKCSELLGWSCIARRNVATLEALKWGADIIVLVDDDNIPMNEFYFSNHINALTKPYSGVAVSGTEGWFDVGQLLDPVSPHRGFPYNVSVEGSVSPIVNASIGVNAGICMGDPDISAATRIARRPIVHLTSHLLDNGVVVGDGTWTVWNSQNTSFIRELAPAMFMMPGVGRYDDIYASLICQRVMRDRGLHVKFGRPYVFQERNQHNLIKDLRAEIDGMEHTVGFSQYLAALSFDGGSIIDQVRAIYKSDEKYLPTKSVMAALAFLEDCEKVMG